MRKTISKYSKHIAGHVAGIILSKERKRNRCNTIRLIRMPVMRVSYLVNQAFQHGARHALSRMDAVVENSPLSDVEKRALLIMIDNLKNQLDIEYEADK